MSGERISAALKEATDTRSVLIRAGALASVADVFEQSFGETAAVIVADENTFEIAGREVRRHLDEAGRETVEPYVFPGRPTLYASYENVEKLRDRLCEQDATAIAVGSGTLNDIVKRSCYECDRSYMCVGTAASMDGYTAFGASITKDGLKQTLACSAPRALLADVNILVNAPLRMTASGYADLLGKVTAGADWIVADALEVEKIDPTGWSLVQDHLREWIGAPERLRARDHRTMEHLIEGLVMSGLGMQSYQSSRTASGAEHQFSHLWEMEGLGRHDDPPLSHGFKVGVGSVAIAALYERVLARDLDDLDIHALRASWPSRSEAEKAVRTAHTIPELEESALEQSLDKHISADELAQRLELLRERWPKMRDRLAEQLMPAEQIREMLRAAGCPTRPIEIGLGWADFKATYSRARTIRKRYTILDLTAEAGIFDECVEELFVPGGLWAREGALRGAAGGETAAREGIHLPLPSRRGTIES